MNILNSKKISLLTLCIGFSLLSGHYAYALQNQFNPPPSPCFDIISDGLGVPVLFNEDESPGVLRALQDFRTDVEKASGSLPSLVTSLPNADKFVLAGTLGKNEWITRLAEEGKIDLSGLDGAWDGFLHQVVEAPFPGVEQVLVVAGSDKRGTIFGLYELSKQIGVSPWYFWADVPIEKKQNVAVVPGCTSLQVPTVQYRGIFLNDENPALLGWVLERYGGFNHEFYSDVFELILRLKGNYLWPAMWGKAFYDDDPKNGETADLYGIVIGTSHHEPMGRAHVEWDRYGEGAWNYQTNEEVLQKFWIEGIERIGPFEATISLGMRGDGDEPMSNETNIKLLEKIVADQRDILNKHGEKLENKLQVWALYKEVQDYYEQGMRVPDDVMLLLADDNWGNLRLLPKADEAAHHPGGWGIYYHFDYVGGPRNYKWINTNQISRTWEQMNLAYHHGATRMWLVNVGDLKPMEFPISFFLDHAWNPEAMTVDKMEAYPKYWAKEQFGAEYAKQIGDMLTEYTKYTARRKPELLDPHTYSLFHFREAERIVEDYAKLTARAEILYDKIPQAYKDAFYQLLLYPIKATATVNKLYVKTAKNRLYAAQGRAATNRMAAEVERLFNLDAELTNEYHTNLADGKWNHMMSQTRIGYTYWQQPEENVMPEVEIIETPEKADMGMMVEGDEKWWPEAKTETARLPVFDPFNQQQYYVELFNRGKTPFSYSISTDNNWLEFSEKEGEIDEQKRVFVSINWQSLPPGATTGSFTIKARTGQSFTVLVDVANVDKAAFAEFSGFIESNGYVAIEAAHFNSTVGRDSIYWQEIPDLGRTLSGMTPFPVTAPANTIFDEQSPRLEYNIYLFNSGEVKVDIHLAPTLNYLNEQGLRYAISFNDEEPKIINMHENLDWDKTVADYINIQSSTHQIDNAGPQVLKIWMVDSGVVIQRIVIESEEIGRTYLGPPESFFKN